MRPESPAVEKQDGPTSPSAFVWPPADGDASEDGALPTPPIAKGFIEAKPQAGPESLRRVLGTARPRWQDWAEQIEGAFLGCRGRVLTGRDGRWSPEPVWMACPRCGRSVGHHEFSEADGRCVGCRPEKLAWDRLVRLGEFSGELREAVHAVKYARWRAQGMVLGRLLGYRLLDALREAGHSPSSAVLVPTPMPALRRIGRGIDHALVLARGVSETSGVRIAPLLRRRHGRPQVRIAPSARAMNLRGKIWFDRRGRDRGSPMILVDDVKTTGATLRACSRAILGASEADGVLIWAAVVSVTPEKNRRKGRENVLSA